MHVLGSFLNLQHPRQGKPAHPAYRAARTWRKIRPMQLSSWGSCSGKYWTTERYASTAST